MNEDGGAGGLDSPTEDVQQAVQETLDLWYRTCAPPHQRRAWEEREKRALKLRELRAMEAHTAALQHSLRDSSQKTDLDAERGRKVRDVGLASRRGRWGNKPIVTDDELGAAVEELHVEQPRRSWTAVCREVGARYQLSREQVQKRLRSSHPQLRW